MQGFKRAAIAAMIAVMPPAVNAADCLIEAEAFQFKGKWVVEKSSDCLGTAMLRVYADSNTAPEADALTVINIPEAGTYKVWTRSQDYVGSARPRTYTLTVGGREMAPCGAHGAAGFAWECVGQVSLGAGQTLLRLADTGLYYGRCDAILLTTDGTLNPNSLTNAELARYRRKPADMPVTTQSAPALEPDRIIEPGYKVLASASNADIRLSFVSLPDNGGIVCKTDYYAGGTWRRHHSQAEDNRVALIAAHDAAPTVNFNSYYPAWDVCAARRTFEFDGQTYPVQADGDRGNPFYAGILSEPRVADVTKTAGNCVKVTYDCGTEGSLTGYWTVPESGCHVNVRFLFKPAADGAYTIALHGAKGIDDSERVSGVMPPMFAGKRLPSGAQMMCSSMMTQCVAAVADGDAAAFVAADLDAFPADWGGIDNSPVAFTLRNSRAELQAVGFAPVPGMPSSRIKAGRTLEVRFVAGITPGRWADALAYVSGNVHGVADYRSPAGCSLTQTLFNVADLIKSDEFSGWSPELKGFWDIEADGSVAPTVVQAAPLALIGAATLMNDEQMYERRALPAIEYMLSRPGYRSFGGGLPAADPAASQFPTTAYEGINTLTGGLNPWLGALALPGGEIRAANGYFSTLQPFRQELAAYRLTGDESRLERAEELARGFADEIMADHPADAAPGTFYNSRMVADWTPLLDLYEATGNEAWLHAAGHSAAHTLAGVKTWPRVAAGEMTVHPGGAYDGVTTIWWKGAERFRLGFPRQPGDAPEHSVEAAAVSSVGLGIEQPATYFLRTQGKTVRPVFMNSWAPRLLELGARTDSAIFTTYARNAVIGRGANYPGYYATGYTDLTMGDRYPYAGPDVSSIYYHHIPAYMALVQDFLITEFRGRSGGAIDFTPARQEGFVWFANNIYGTLRGTVNGEEAELYMPRGLVEVDNPAINVLTARSGPKLYVMLTNDGAEEVTVSPRIAGVDNAGSVTVAPGKVEILTFEADLPEALRPEPLAEGMARIETSTAAGTIYLYRIRSPFGWDSVYGYCTGSGSAGLTVRAECGNDAVEATAVPYEWSFAHIAPEANPEVRITIGGQSFSHKFGEDGGITEIPRAGNGPTRGIWSIDGRRLKEARAPGVYIIDGRLTIRGY